jgi:ferritin-like metal-binding protein YciE
VSDSVAPLRIARELAGRGPAATDHTLEGSMPDIKEQLVKYLTDAHSLEQHVSRQLDTMIRTTDDPEMRGHFEHHKEETERHKTRLEERLEAYGASPSVVKEAGQMFMALGAGLANATRKDNAGKNARDGFVAEHMEIASYELLERVAQLAGDDETVEVARGNRADEEAMADKIAANWDKAAIQSLRQEGVDLPAGVDVAGRSA